MSHPMHTRRSARIAAKAELLLECARQYAHGCAPAADVLSAAIDYSRTVDEPTHNGMRKENE